MSDISSDEVEGLVPDKDVVEVRTRKRWRDYDDEALLQQVSLKRPFLLTTNRGNAWDHVAGNLLKVDGFSRSNIDGKKASSRFSMLISISS